MTILEISQMVTAVSVAVAAIAIVVLVRQTMPVMRRLDDLTREATTTVQRMNRITADAELVVRDARQLESRVARTADWLLDRVEPPLRSVGALAVAVSTGVEALLKTRRSDGDGSQPRQSMTTTRRES